MSFTQGKITEQAFTDYLYQTGQVKSVEAATKQEDINEHWDLKVIFNDKVEHLYDVKGIRKKQRYGAKDDTIHWVELRNVAGKPGWLKGKATHIVFETFTEWIVISPTKIEDLLKKRIAYPVPYVKKATDALYKLYTRKGRKDIITMVLTSDLKENADKIYKK